MTFQMLIVPLILLYVCSVLVKLSVNTGFPQFWSQQIQIIAAIISFAFFGLPWIFNRAIHKEIESKQSKKPYNYKESILIIGFACTTVPALSGFFLFLSGGGIRETFWFAMASFIVGAIWAVFSFTTYLKRPANHPIKRTE
jgi:hypothetical protein